ncbi:hypothetical protein D3C72_411600 [compost metagenome]
MTRPITKYGKRMAIYDHPRRLRLPIVQNKISFIVFLDMAVRKATTAPRNVCIITPDRIRLSVGIFPPSLARARTTHNVITPVTKAIIGSVKIPIKENCQPKKISTAAPTEDPEDTPSVKGSASGLRRTPWKAAPARARDDPTIKPSSTRGRRTLSTICSDAVLQSGVIHSPRTGTR